MLIPRLECPEPCACGDPDCPFCGNPEHSEPLDDDSAYDRWNDENPNRERETDHV